MQCSLGNQGGLAKKVLSLKFVLKGLIVPLWSRTSCAHILRHRHYLASTGLHHVPAALFEYKSLRSVGLNMPSGNNGGEEEYLVPGIEPRLCNSVCC